MIIWRLWVTAMWFGVAAAATTVVIAAALIAVLLAVLVGLVMPSRTVGGQLRSLYANSSEANERIQALRPSV